MRIVRITVFFLVLLCTAGCAGLTTDLPLDAGGNELMPGDAGYDIDLQVKYLAAGGVLLKRGPDVIVLAPFFSNPSLGRVLFGTVRSEPAQVDRFLRPIANHLKHVTAILVGHAHHDHLMDVPYAKKAYMPDARIYGSDTMQNILAGAKEVDQNHVIPVESQAGNADKVGKWWKVAPRIRVMALESEHAAVFLRIHFAPGNYTAPLQELPTNAFDWRAGKTLAYLIDFLGPDDRVDFRIHYQDAASTAPAGFPPQFTGSDAAPVDVAFVCLPGFDQVKDYPRTVIDHLQPRFVVGIHWENFFSVIPDDLSQLRTVPTFPAGKFMREIREAIPAERFKLPIPGAWLRFAPVQR